MAGAAIVDTQFYMIDSVQFDFRGCSRMGGGAAACIVTTTAVDVDWLLNIGAQGISSGFNVPANNCGSSRVFDNVGNTYAVSQVRIANDSSERCGIREFIQGNGTSVALIIEDVDDGATSFANVTLSVAGEREVRVGEVSFLLDRADIEFRNIPLPSGP